MEKPERETLFRDLFDKRGVEYYPAAKMDAYLADLETRERVKAAKLLEALKRIRNEGTYKGVDSRSMVDNKLIEGKWTQSRAASIARKAIAEYKEAFVETVTSRQLPTEAEYKEEL